MPPTTSPEFETLHRALSEIPWLSNTGKMMPIALPLPYRFADTASEAHASIAAPDWENWTLERRNELTAFLSDHFPARDAEWSAIARRARRIVDEEVAPASARVDRSAPCRNCRVDVGCRQRADGSGLPGLPPAAVLHASRGGIPGGPPARRMGYRTRRAGDLLRAPRTFRLHDRRLATELIGNPSCSRDARAER